MTRSTYRVCSLCGDIHNLEDWPDNHREWRPDNRSDLSAPMIVSDNLEAWGGLNGLQSQVDGRHYTSKARMRAEYRARGVEEMGNEPARLASHHHKRKPSTKEAIRPYVERAFSKVELTTPTKLRKSKRKQK